MTVLDTIKEKAEIREGKTNKSVSIEKIRAHNSDKNLEELGEELERLLKNGEIYESEPARFCHI